MKSIIVLIILAILVSIVWWNLWMYHGFLRAPQFMKFLMNVDGESSYDLALVEFFAFSEIVLIAGYFVIRKILKKK